MAGPRGGPTTPTVYAPRNRPERQRLIRSDTCPFVGPPPRPPPPAVGPTHRPGVKAEGRFTTRTQRTPNRVVLTYISRGGPPVGPATYQSDGMGCPSSGFRA